MQKDWPESDYSVQGKLLVPWAREERWWEAVGFWSVAEVDPPELGGGRNVGHQGEEAMVTKKLFTWGDWSSCMLSFIIEILSLFTPTGGSENSSWLSELWLRSTLSIQSRYLQTLQNSVYR